MIQPDKIVNSLINFDGTINVASLRDYLLSLGRRLQLAEEQIYRVDQELSDTEVIETPKADLAAVAEANIRLTILEQSLAAVASVENVKDVLPAVEAILKAAAHVSIPVELLQAAILHEEQKHD